VGTTIGMTLDLYGPVTDTVAQRLDVAPQGAIQERGNAGEQAGRFGSDPAAAPDPSFRRAKSEMTSTT
jgi:hypothetical protein